MLGLEGGGGGTLIVMLFSSQVQISHSFLLIEYKDNNCLLAIQLN